MIVIKNKYKVQHGNAKRASHVSRDEFPYLTEREYKRLQRAVNHRRKCR